MQRRSVWCGKARRARNAVGKRDAFRRSCGVVLSLCCFAVCARGDIARILDVGDSWVFFPYALQSPPALEEVLARPEFDLGQYREDGSIGLTNIFAEGWDTPEQLQKIADRLAALPTLDICHVSLGGNDIVHTWKQFMSPAQVDTMMAEIIGHIRNVVQFCLDQRPDVRVALLGYDYVNLYEGFMINDFGEVWDYESITHWAVTYWGYPIPANRQEVLEIVREVHDIWAELERRKIELAQEFPGRVTYIHNFGYVQHVFGVPAEGVEPGEAGIPDGPENGYANFPNGRPDLYNPRIVMKIDDGEMDPLHLNAEGFLTFMENAVRQCYAAWLADSTPPVVASIRPLAEAANPTDAPEVIFEVKFTEPVTGVDVTDFSVRTSASVSDAVISDMSGADATCFVTVSGMTGAGTVALDLVDDDTIYDAVWYPLKRLDDGSFRGVQAYWLGGGLLDCAQATALEMQGNALYDAQLGGAWPFADLDGNGIPDRFELALAARLCCDTSYPGHDPLQAAIASNAAALESEPGFAALEPYTDAIAAFCAISPDLRDGIVSALSLTAAYSVFELDMAFPLASLGDPDGDEISNLFEYDWVVDQECAHVEYAIAASTAGCGPDDLPTCPDPSVFDDEAEAFFVALQQGIEWKDADWGDNGIPDRYELALLGRVFCDGRHPLHDPLALVYADNRAALEADPAAELFLPYIGYLSLFAASSQEAADSIAQDMALTAPIAGLQYESAEPFAAASDLDGDGASNDREFTWTFIRGGSPEVYADEASDPNRAPDAAIPNCDVAVTFESQGRDFYEFAFEEDVWQTADADVSMIPDRYEISVLAAILCDEHHPLHETVQQVHDANLALLRVEPGIPFLAPVFDIMAALATLDQAFADILKAGLSLEGDYAPYSNGADLPLSSLGDLDLDGALNYEEFENIGGLDATVPEYVRAVLGSYYPPAPELTVDPLITNDSRPAITGTVRYSVALGLSLDGATWRAVLVDNNEWVHNVPDPLPDGVYDVRVRAVGAYNREGHDSTTDELIIDTVAPVIALNGPGRLTAEAGEPYLDPGATAMDDREGDISERLNMTNNVNPSLIDTFSVTYDVEDTAGNFALTATRIVDVRDRTIPVITMLGDAEMTVEAAEPFNDPGATAWDSFSGDITPEIRVTGSVDVMTPGTYVLAYDVRDANRNDAVTVSRTVHVVDTQPPFVTLLGPADMSVPVGEPFAEPGVVAWDALDGDLSAAVVVIGMADTEILGAYVLTYTAQDAAGNVSIPAVRTVHVVDEVPPVLSVTGDNPLTHEAPEPYNDPGATAFDNYDGDLTAAIQTANDVNPAIPGDYTVTYSLADSSGNPAQALRAVHVVDTTAPIITVTGPSELTHEAATPYADPGATAADTVDGDLTAAIVVTDNVNVAVLGDYTVAYSVEDASGNTADAQRLVHVADTTPPVITLIGPETLLHEAGTAYADPGAIAADSRQGDLTALLQVENTVDEDTPGAYTVTYRVSDSEGNEAQPSVRHVLVADSTAPTLVLIGDAIVTLRCFDDFMDPGAMAFDLVDGDRTAFIRAESSIVEHSPGEYPVTYRVADSQGNEAEPVVRTVIILDDCGHTADQNGDFRIGLAELLRVIQFYNTKSHHCELGTEDGYAPGPGGQWCPPHDLDYAPADWRIDLSELLRVVQFYNAGGCYPCPDSGTEDGFCFAPN